MPIRFIDSTINFPTQLPSPSPPSAQNWQGGAVMAEVGPEIVLRQGEVVEQGECERLFASPEAAYTRELLQSTQLNLR